MKRRSWAIVLCVALVCTIGSLANNFAQQRATLSMAVFGLRASAGASISSAIIYVERGLDSSAKDLDRAWAINVTQELVHSSVESIAALETTDQHTSDWMQVRFSLELALQELADWQQAPASFSRAQETLDLLAAIQKALPSVISKDNGGTVYGDNPAALADAAAFAEGYVQRINAARRMRQGS